MEKPEELVKKDTLIKKYSNKPIPKFLKYLGNIRELNEYESWIKDQKVIILKWIGTYLIFLPFIFLICLTALGLFRNTPKVLVNFFLAEGSSIVWYLFISLIKDIRGAIKNG